MKYLLVCIAAVSVLFFAYIEGFEFGVRISKQAAISAAEDVVKKQCH